MKFAKKILVMLLFLMCITFNVYGNDSVNASGWAVENVKQAVDEGLIDTSLASDAKSNMKRKDVCSLALNFYKNNEGVLPSLQTLNPFNDYNSNEAAIAVKLGIMNGVSSDKFDPEGIVTREQIAVIVNNTLKSLEISTTANSTNKFIDNADISAWAVDSVYGLKNAGILNGSNGRFNPKDGVTVEQAATTFLMAKNNVFSGSTQTLDTGKLKINENTIALNDSLETLTKNFGKPGRIDDTGLGFKRYVFNTDYTKFMIVGVKDDKVVEIYSNVNRLSYKNMTPSSTLSNILALSNANQTESGMVMIENSDSVVTITLDSLNNFRLCAVHIAEKGLLDNKFANESVIERELFDIVNSARVKYNLQALSYETTLAEIAKSHSEVLGLKSTLVYTVNGATPFDRMENAGIKFSHAAENVSWESSPYLIYSEWINSIGTRMNIMDMQLTMSGVGCKINNGVLYTTMDLYKL